MGEPRWITKGTVLSLHQTTLWTQGGLQKSVDDALLESALGRPRNRFVYGDPNLLGLAASYAFGLAKDHAFSDGNKRISFIVTELFLDLNGVDLVATDSECVSAWLDLADGKITEDQMAAWLHLRTRAR